MRTAAADGVLGDREVDQPAGPLGEVAPQLTGAEEGADQNEARRAALKPAGEPGPRDKRSTGYRDVQLGAQDRHALNLSPPPLPIGQRLGTD
jgi:hypothetical protein